MPRSLNVKRLLTRAVLSFKQNAKTLIVSTLLALAAALAAFNYYTISDSFARAQGYYEARQRASLALESLFREESSLRGYTSTHDPQYLSSYSAAHQRFEEQFAQLQRYLWDVRLRGAASYLSDIQRVHDQWVTTVARPLIRNPGGTVAEGRQRTGELLFSTLGDDVAALRSDLESDVAASSDDMRFHILSAIAQIALLTAFFGVTILSMRASNRRAERQYLLEITDANRTLVSAQRLAGVGNWTEDLPTGKVLWSEELYRIFGVREETPPAGLLRRFDHPDDAGAVQDAIEQFNRTSEPYRIDHRIVLRDGSVRYVQEQAECSYDGNGKPLRVIGTLLDVTDRKVAETGLAYLAHHDALTGLPNRTMLIERLSHSMAYAQRQKRFVAVLFLDLDRFKVINDTLGHTVGDDLLRAVGARLQSTIRGTDTVARSGGDEFIMVLGDLAGPGDLIAASKAIIGAFEQPFQVDGDELFATSSIGVSVYPRDGEDVDTLIKNADAALYQAKDRGRNNVQYYTADLHQAALRKMSLENDMRKSIDRGDFVVHYQPLVGLRVGKVVGFEALVRWKHPTLGLMMPDDFIPVAEESGLILPLGEMVLRMACEQQKAWSKAGFANRRVTVNISARQFQQRDLAASIGKIMTETGIMPSGLEIELTESLLMKDVQGSLATLRQLKDMGIALSIDDFGTGYSSLGYLKNFPIDGLKIDRTFVRDLTADRYDAAISAAIVALARSLDMHVIAEGVETEQQLAHLQRLGCDTAQGFLFGQPLSPEGCIPLLQRDWAWDERRAEPA